MLNAVGSERLVVVSFSCTSVPRTTREFSGICRPCDPTPIICEITPRTEQRIYGEGVRIQSLAEFFRLSDVSYHATGHKAQKVRVTGYLMWDDDHNGAADVGSTVQWLSGNGFHHPWRSTAWEVHPVIKIEVIE